MLCDVCLATLRCKRSKDDYNYSDTYMYMCNVNQCNKQSKDNCGNVRRSVAK